MIFVAPGVDLDEALISLEFLRASGPGGQNVNKVETAVRLRYAVARAALPEDVRARLLALAGRRATEGGEILIEASRFRTQERNRQDALDRLLALMQRAAVAPVPRRATRPTRASKERRLASKRVRGDVKRQRREPPGD